MKKTTLFAIFIVLLFGVTQRGFSLTIINWTSYSNFNSATMTFGGISTNSVFFSDIDSFQALFHSHGGFVNVKIDALLDGTWTNIFSTGITGFASTTLNSLGTLNFAPGIVSGMRFTSVPGQNQTFHYFNGMRMNFAAPATVPEPGTAVLLCLGLVGLGSWGRKRMKVNN